jgi:dTDP-4-dehydrorhamnose reductase
MRRFAVTGRTGQLGRWLVRLLERDPEASLVLATGREELDLEDPPAVEKLFDGLAEGPPEVLVNAAAMTAVDRCESEEARALLVNAESPRRLARLCRRHGVRFVHVSTDFVFDGDAREPYREDAPARPRTAYGRSKLAGELLVLEEDPDALVVRSSWVFGPGRNFAVAILDQARKRRAGEVAGPLRVVADQQGRPTYSADLAEGILALVEEEGRGLFHVCNDGVASWWGFARAILDGAGFEDLEIERISAADYPRPARTPMYSVLDTSRAAAAGVRLRHWREGLADYLAAPDGPLARDSR